MAGSQGSEADTTTDPEDSPRAIEAVQRVRANLRFPDSPFAAPSADHDAGLRALGLLGFVRLDLPSPDADLVAELIVNHIGWRSRSSVRGRHVDCSLESFANALFLPAKPSYVDPVGSGWERAMVTSAAKVFTKLYIQPPLEAITNGGSHVPFWFSDWHDLKDGRLDVVNWARLLWILTMDEMDHLVWDESSDGLSYCGAYLQRLICVQIPELFRRPSGPDAWTTASDPDMHTIQARSKQMDLTFSRIDLASEKLAAASEMIHLTSKKFDAAWKKFDSASEIINVASKKFDSVSSIVNAASKMMEAASKQLEERAGQSSDQDGGVHGMESINQALITKERECNDELQGARKMLVEALQKFTNGRSHIAVKRMGEIDPKAFANACRRDVPH